MMQSFASAARLLGGGPILSRGIETMGWGGSPPPRIVLALASRRAGWTPISVPMLAPALFRTNRSDGGAQLGARRHLARRDVAPQCDQQLAGQCDNHLGAPDAPRMRGARLEPLRQGAVLLEHEPAPSQL